MALSLDGDEVTTSPSASSLMARLNQRSAMVLRSCQRSKTTAVGAGGEENGAGDDAGSSMDIECDDAAIKVSIRLTISMCSIITDS